MSAPAALCTPLCGRVSLIRDSHSRSLGDAWLTLMSLFLISISWALLPLCALVETWVVVLAFLFVCFVVVGFFFWGGVVVGGGGVGGRARQLQGICVSVLALVISCRYVACKQCMMYILYIIREKHTLNVVPGNPVITSESTYILYNVPLESAWS